jgi:hypothetical protein
VRVMFSAFGENLLMYRRSPLSTAEVRRASSWRSEFCIKAGHTYQPHEPATSSHEPALLPPAKRLNQG